MVDMKMYINGQFCDASDGKKIEVICPEDEHVVGYVPAGTAQDGKKALEAAQAASHAWMVLPPQTRAGYVKKLRDLLSGRKEEFARLLSEEHGKPISEARGEIDAALSMMDSAVAWAPRIKGEILYSSQKDEQIMIQRVPYGVVVGISAWNYPLCLAARKFAIGLVCGNTMVIKPPSLTPAATMKLGELVHEAGFPKGVFNLVSGSGSTIGEELIRNPITKMASLTGSTPAGQELYRAAAENITVLRLELGGKAPFIVMDDADIVKAVEGAVAARFSNCGQVCTCNDRMYIHEKVYDEFMEKFIARVKQIKIGPSLAEDTQMGPKVSKDEVDKLWNMYHRAVEQGAKVLYGGKPLEGPLFEKGFWFPPTVLEVEDNSLDIMHQETFGPMIAAMKVKSLEEAVAYANDCVYGLSAYLYTRSHKNIMIATRDLEFGEIYTNRSIGEELNAFHNGYKTSGVGGEDGEHGMEGFMQKKTVYLNYNYQD